MKVENDTDPRHSQVSFVDLSGRNLEHLPSHVLEQEHVINLCLRDNQLETVPIALFDRLRSLTWLDLRCNSLTELPVEIRYLVHLRHLLLDDNKLTHLPRELGLCVSLTGLHLSRNPLVEPPLAVCRKGCKAALCYLRQLLSPDLSGNLAPADHEFESLSLSKPSDRQPRDISIAPDDLDLWCSSPHPTRSIKLTRNRKLEATRVQRRAAAVHSTAYLAGDQRIKFKTPILPNAEDVELKTALLRNQKNVSARNATIMKELERGRLAAGTKKWKHETRTKQLEQIRKLKSGELEVPHVNAPYGVIGDTASLAAKKRLLEPVISSIFSTSRLHSREEISAIRQKVQNLIGKVALCRNETDKDKQLAAAENHIEALQQISRMIY